MFTKFDRAFVYFYWQVSVWMRTPFDTFKGLYKWKGLVAVASLQVFVILALVNFVTVIIDQPIVGGGAEKRSHTDRGINYCR